MLAVVKTCYLIKNGGPNKLLRHRPKMREDPLIPGEHVNHFAPRKIYYANDCMNLATVSLISGRSEVEMAMSRFLI